MKIMYSDEWLKLGYTSSEPIEVSDIVFYRVWTHQNGAEIGAGVDFETENDFHYEIPIEEWQRFVSDVLRVYERTNLTAKFREYFVKNKGLFDFERDLKTYGIGYQKIVFY